MTKPPRFARAQVVMVNGRRFRVTNNLETELYQCDRCGQGGYASLKAVQRCCSGAPRENRNTGRARFLIQKEEE